MKTIKIKPEHQSIIKDYCEKENDAKIAFELASSMVRLTHEKFWDFVHDLYPEVKDKNRCVYNAETNTITIFDEE